MAVIKAKQLHNPHRHPSAMTCPQDTLRITAVLVLEKARRKLNSGEVGFSIHKVYEEVQLNTQPQHMAQRSAAARSSHSPCYRPTVFFRHLRLAAPLFPHGKKKEHRRAFSKLVYNCVTSNFVSRAVHVQVS